MTKKYKIILEKQHTGSVLLSAGSVSEDGSASYEPISVLENDVEIEIVNPHKIPIKVSEE
jgi:hypothetical protein